MCSGMVPVGGVGCCGGEQHAQALDRHVPPLFCVRQGRWRAHLCVVPLCIRMRLEELTPGVSPLIDTAAVVFGSEGLVWFGCRCFRRFAVDWIVCTHADPSPRRHGVETERPERSARRLIFPWCGTVCYRCAERPSRQSLTPRRGCVWLRLLGVGSAVSAAFSGKNPQTLTTDQHVTKAYWQRTVRHIDGQSACPVSARMTSTTVAAGYAAHKRRNASAALTLPCASDNLHLSRGLHYNT